MVSDIVDGNPTGYRRGRYFDFSEYAIELYAEYYDVPELRGREFWKWESACGEHFNADADAHWNRDNRCLLVDFIIENRSP